MDLERLRRRQLTTYVEAVQLIVEWTAPPPSHDVWRVSLSLPSPSQVGRMETVDDVADG